MKCSNDMTFTLGQTNMCISILHEQESVTKPTNWHLHLINVECHMDRLQIVSSNGGEGAWPAVAYFHETGKSHANNESLACLCIHNVN